MLSHFLSGINNSIARLTDLTFTFQETSQESEGIIENKM